MRTLIQGALDTAKSKGANVHNAVAMGYCFGGAAVLEFTRSGADLKGFVTFHGGLSTPKGQDYSKTRGKLLILHGTADKNITMDQFMVDITGIYEKMKIKTGDEAVLIGSSGKKSITAEDIAELLGTINYEVTCMLKTRVPKIYI